MRCPVCRSRLSRLNAPARYAYNMVKESARKRDIPFLLSFDEFQAFCRRTGYLEKKGRNKESMTIDRIDSSKPYQADNIRPMSWIDNCSHACENDDSHPF